MALSSPHSPPSLLLTSRTAPPTPSFFHLRTLIPQTQFSKTPRVSIRSHGNRHYSILQAFQSFTSSDPSFADENPPSSRIFIKGLSRSTSEGSLVKAFSCFGDINRVKIISSKTSKESLGLAYIWFAREEDALSAVKEMDGKFVDGRFIAVMIARPESPTKQHACSVLSIADANTT